MVLIVFIIEIMLRGKLLRFMNDIEFLSYHILERKTESKVSLRSHIRRKINFSHVQESFQWTDNNIFHLLLTPMPHPS